MSTIKPVIKTIPFRMRLGEEGRGRGRENENR